MNLEEIAGSAPVEVPFDLETVFIAAYDRIARVIARVVGDRGRAEEIAVEVFLRLWRTPKAHGERMEGWLYRTAVRAGLDDIRRQTRRSRYERLARFMGGSPSPEEILAAKLEQDRVRLVLTAIGRRQAEILILRSHGLSYDEIAKAVEVNPASVGTLLSRAQQAFRKEYLKRYGG